jgi:hypothetical protein
VSSAVSGWHRGTLLMRPVLDPLAVDYCNLSVARPSTDSSSRCISGRSVLGPSSITSLRMVMALPLGLALRWYLVLLPLDGLSAFARYPWVVCGVRKP